MERLTKRNPFDGIIELTKEIGEPIAPYNEVIEALSKLAAYEDLEEQGRLVVLPCKVGDTVYRHIYDEYGIAPIDKGTVYAVSINGQTNWFSVLYKSGLRYDYTWEDLSKTVFLTREEAEAALAKGGDE